MDGSSLRMAAWLFFFAFTSVARGAGPPESIVSTGKGSVKVEAGRYSDPNAWERYLAQLAEIPADVRPPREEGIWGIRFHRAESQCTGNAFALLAANDLIKAAPQRWDFTYSPAWGRRLVMRAILHDATGSGFSFACLLGPDAVLERTRLLDPTVHSGPLEIDDARYLYPP